MKDFLVLFFSLALVLSSCTDPCESVACLNGGECSEGTCVCPADYWGDNCEMTHPSQCKITGIKLSSWPTVNEFGIAWDLGSNPDVYISVVGNGPNGEIDYGDSFTAFDIMEGSEISFSIAATVPVGEDIAFVLLEEDLTAGEWMGGVAKNLFDGTQTYPSTITLSDPNQNIEMELEVEWIP